MKRIIFAICTILCANVLWAQEQLAVLKHNDSTSVFYGASAFIQAYNAATHGDIITLSDGIFTTPSYIRKGITVRGNGACADTARKSTGTYFMERFFVYNLGDSLQFSAEGIYFDDFYAQSSYDIKLTRCYIDGLIKSGYNTYRAGGLQATNCVIINGGLNYYLGGDNNRNDRYINCILKATKLNASQSYISGHYLPSYSICSNCIMIGVRDISSPYQYNNCIVIRGNNSIATILNGSVNNSLLIGFTGTDSPASSGNVAMSLSDVFENWDGETISTDLETYVLKSSVSDSIQGIDGTEVGIFGGFMPFDWRPSYNIFKRFNVANRTTADGKLSVDIEVISE